MELVIRKKGKKYYIIGKDGKKETNLGGPYNSEADAVSELKNNSKRYIQWTTNINYKSKMDSVKFEQKLKRNPLELQNDSLKIENQKIKNEIDNIKLETAKQDTVKKPIAKIPVGMLDPQFLEENGYVISEKDSYIIFYDQDELKKFNSAKTAYEIDKEKIAQEKLATTKDSMTVKQQAVTDSLGNLIDVQKLKERELIVEKKESDLTHKQELDAINIKIKQIEGTRDSLGVVTEEQKIELNKLNLEKKQLEIDIKQLEKNNKMLSKKVHLSDKGEIVKKLTSAQIESLIKAYKKQGVSYIMNSRLGKDTASNRHLMDLHKKELLDYDSATYGPIFDELESGYEAQIKDIEEYKNKSSIGKMFDRMFSF